MKNIGEEMLEGDIKLSMSLFKGIKFLKLIFSIFLIILYFLDSSWFVEFLLISVVLTLVSPIGFFDVFIQKLLEYNTQKLEMRMQLNAEETNKAFEDIYNKNVNGN